MGSFSGGSAWAMARDIGEGFVLVTERTFQRMQAREIESLSFEIQRYLRDIRGKQSPTDPMAEIQKRNRRIQKLNAALAVLRAFQSRR